MPFSLYPANQLVHWQYKRLLHDGWEIHIDLRDTAQPESASPVSDLPHCNSVYALVDASDSIFAVNIHEGRHRAWDLLAARGSLVLRHFDRLHARAEAHSGISLGQPTRHTTTDTRNKVGGAKRLCVVFGFAGDEKEDGTLGRGFDPSPRDETLVDCAES